MKEFLMNYGGTIIVLLLVILVVVLSILKIIKNRKDGKCSCGCDSCGFKDNCHKK